MTATVVAVPALAEELGISPGAAYSWAEYEESTGCVGRVSGEKALVICLDEAKAQKVRDLVGRIRAEWMSPEGVRPAGMTLWKASVGMAVLEALASGARPAAVVNKEVRAKTGSGMKNLREVMRLMKVARWMRMKVAGAQCCVEWMVELPKAQ